MWNYVRKGSPDRNGDPIIKYLSPTAFLENYLIQRKGIENRNHGKLRQKVERMSWMNNPGIILAESSMVAAFYLPHANAILIPAGLLQGEFFSSEQPEYLNYGGVGAIIGHEITHGFGRQGSQRDELGNMEDWWQPETKQK